MLDARQAEITGTVESDPMDRVNFLRRFTLPPPRRMAEAEARTHVEPLQVIRRFYALRLLEDDLFTPGWRWKAIYRDSRGGADRPGDRPGSIRFEGTKVSELNRFLRESGARVVLVAAPELAADETLRVPSGTTLEGGGALLAARSPIEVAIEVRDGSAVRVHGFEITGRYRVGICVKNGSSITLDGNQVHDIEGRGIVVMGRVAGLDLVRNSSRSNGHGGIFLRGDIGPGLIEGNRVEDNRGTANLTAGLVLSSFPVGNIDDPEERVLPAGHSPQLQCRLEAPHDLVIRRNVLERNNSSGIYSDGSYLVSLIENSIVGNDKEGVCLDFGTLGAFMHGNRIAGNGGRSRQTDEDLTADFVHHFGRMKDGSAIAKLPGVSLDNAAYNIIHANTLIGNFGGGIKVVRTGARNLFCHNTLIDNNRGQNDVFHFFGIELGNAPGDFPTDDLDVAPDFENIVYRNTIDGNHYAGIFLADGCHCNDLLENRIFGSICVSIEVLSGLENIAKNNISNVPSRGISLDAAEGGDAGPRRAGGRGRMFTKFKAIRSRLADLATGKRAGWAARVDRVENRR